MAQFHAHQWRSCSRLSRDEAAHDAPADCLPAIPSACRHTDAASTGLSSNRHLDASVIAGRFSVINTAMAQASCVGQGGHVRLACDNSTPFGTCPAGWRGFFIAMDGGYAENAGAIFRRCLDGRTPQKEGLAVWVMPARMPEMQRLSSAVLADPIRPKKKVIYRPAHLRS